MTKITVDRKVLEQALGALLHKYSDLLYDDVGSDAPADFEDDIAAIKALAQPAAQQESSVSPDLRVWVLVDKAGVAQTWRPPLFTGPETDSEIDRLNRGFPSDAPFSSVMFAAPQPAVQQEPAGEPVNVYCETCNGSGRVYQEHQAGCHVGGYYACPDCDGKGYNIRPTRPAVPLSDERIDRAIAELGLNYLADAANNRALLRELCRKAAHKIGNQP